MGTVFDRKLAFDELNTLKDMNAGLKRTIGCKVVDMVAIDKAGMAGTVALEKE